MIEIIPFEPKHANAFKSLNTEWIEQVFEKVGDADSAILDNPEGEIIGKGGAVMIALMDNRVVGTCALISRGNRSYELAKMAVTSEARGNSIGEKLGRKIIATAQELDAAKVYLETHSVLVPAISLYRKLGFRDTCNGNANSLCNLQMELNL